MGDNDDDQFKKAPKVKYVNAKERAKDKYGDASKDFDLKATHEHDGMVKKGRKCTDIICCGVFLAFLVGTASLVIYALNNGHVKALVAPIDGNGQFCGVGAYRDYPYLYLRNLYYADAVMIFEKGECVKECPEVGSLQVECMSIHPGSFAQPRNKAYCVPELEAVDQHDTEPYDTKSEFGFCVPRNGDDLPARSQVAFNQAKAQMQASKFGQFISDVYNGRYSLLVSVFISFFYSLTFVYLMSAYGESLAWFCVGLIQVSLLGSGVIIWYWEQWTINNRERNALDGGAYRDATEMSYVYYGLAILFFVLAFIFACCIWWGKKSLKLAIDVIDAAADFTAGNKRVIIVPLVYFGFAICWVVIWLLSFLCVIGLNKITVAEDISDIPQDRDINWEAKNVFLAVFMIFAFFWISAFIQYTSKFIVMAAAGTYYWNSNEEEEGSAELFYAIRIAHINHTGSIALGSFIIGMIRFIEVCFVYFARKAEAASGQNAAVKCIVCCAECIIRIIEKFVDYINQAAYAYMVNTGDNFCTSAYNGFLLNVKNALEFAFANWVAKMFILVGKLTIVILNCATWKFISANVVGDEEQMHNIFSCLFVCFAFTWMTASLFMGIFENSVLCLMTCLTIDMELNDGKPSCGPPTFHERINSVRKEQGKQEKDEGTEMV